MTRHLRYFRGKKWGGQHHDHGCGKGTFPAVLNRGKESFSTVFHEKGRENKKRGRTGKIPAEEAVLLKRFELGEKGRRSQRYLSVWTIEGIPVWGEKREKKGGKPLVRGRGEDRCPERSLLPLKKGN